MKYPINRLLEFDLGNPKSISMSDIVDTILQYYGKSEYDKYYKIVEDRLIKIYFDKNNNPYIKEDLAKKRLNSFHQTLNKKLSLMYKKSSEKINDYEKEKLKNKLILDFYNEVLKMCLPFEDKNTSNKIKQFKEDRLNLVILLKRMGKHLEAKSLLSIKESKIHTFSSYAKEWKKTKLKEYSKIDNYILNDVIHCVKEKYTSQESILKNLNANCRIEKDERKLIEKIVLLSTAKDIAFEIKK